jgi:uncharacterized membrane protein YkoI
MTKMKLFLVGLLLACVVVALAATPIPKSQAEQTALNAVGGGTVTLVQLELHDHPPRWSVDITQASGAQFEVWVQAYTGTVIKVIKG